MPEMIRLGNASAPRWYGEKLEQLGDYIDRLVGFGATSTELILHHGPSDERNARVHIQQHQWQDVVNRFQSRGLHCDLHASLAPAFSLRRWQKESRRLHSQYRPLLEFGERLSNQTGSAVVLVIHAANAIEMPPELNARATSEFLEWALEESGSRGGGLRFAVELRHDPKHYATRFDVDRGMLRRFVEQFDSDRVGICWDIGNDLQQAIWKGIPPELPGGEFLGQVIHVHTHGRGPGGDLHFPLLSPRETAAAWLGLLPGAAYAGSVTLEIRFRLAAARGEPMEVLGTSYQVAREQLQLSGPRNNVSTSVRDTAKNTRIE
jgi:sugar phosphate isomerase/epimerase